MGWNKYKAHKKFTDLNFKSKTVFFEGIHFHYYQYQHNTRKPDLIIIHGFLDSSLTFRYIVKFIIPNFNVYLLDIPGFGKSRLPAIRELWHIDSIARSMARFINDYLNLNKFHILTHSLGGLIAIHILEYLNSNDKKTVIESIHMISPGLLKFSTRNKSRLLSEFYPQNIEGVKELVNNMYFNQTKKMPNWLLEALLHEWSRPGYKYLALNTLPREDQIFYSQNKLKKINVNTRLYWGKQDKVVSVQIGNQIHKYLKNSCLVILPGCGHGLHQEATQLFLESFMSYFQK